MGLGGWRSGGRALAEATGWQIPQGWQQGAGRGHRGGNRALAEATGVAQVAGPAGRRRRLPASIGSLPLLPAAFRHPAPPAGHRVPRLRQPVDPAGGGAGRGPALAPRLRLPAGRGAAAAAELGGAATAAHVVCLPAPAAVCLTRRVHARTAQLVYSAIRGVVTPRAHIHAKALSAEWQASFDRLPTTATVLVMCRGGAGPVCHAGTGQVS